MDQHDQDERRHEESVGIQRKTFYLAVIVAILTVVQTGLVKFPTLLDLRDKPMSSVPLPDHTSPADRSFLRGERP